MPTLKRQTAAFVFFLLLACFIAYMPLFHAGTEFPGDKTTDYFLFNWNFWWIRHALTTPGVNLYETNYVLFPATSNLALQTLVPFWFPLWDLTEPLVGTLAAVDVIMVVALTLAGYTLWLFLQREGVSAGLALIGAAAFELTPSLFRALWWSHLNYISFFWVATHLLLWSQVVRSAGSWRRGLFWSGILGLAFYGTVMTDLQLALFTVPLLVPFGLLTFYQSQQRGRLVMFGILTVGLAVALLWFVGPLPYLLKFDMSTLAPPSADQVHAIPFPDGYFLRDTDYYDNRITLGSFVVPVTLITLAASLTILRRVKDRRRWFWLAISVVPLVLSAGASITIAGINIPLPYPVLHTWVRGEFRVPDHFGTVFIIPAMIFCGRTWTPVLGGRIKFAVVPLLLLAMLIEARIFIPMAVQEPIHPYPIYDQIGQERGKPYDDEVILEVPVAAGSGETWIGQFDQLATQFYGMTHGKRMVNGEIARAPVSSYWYLRTDDSMLSWLGQRRLLEPDKVRQELKDRIFRWPIGYVIVHQDMIGMNSSTIQEIVGYFNSLPDLLCPYTVEGPVVVYRTVWHPDGCPPRTPPEISPNTYQIDIGTSGDERFIGWGWHYPELVSGVTWRWTGAYPQTLLYVDLPPGAYDVTLSAQAYQQARQLRLLANGVDSGTVATVQTDQLAPFTFHVPSSSIGDGKHITFTLIYDGWAIPKDSDKNSTDTRKLAVAVDWIRFTRTDSQPAN
ncbi:MAG TPA: hypothetical protein VKQ72_04870 [Aggregatilineales bacterium]|nr:hypothetical protein [Aggregatilineales bacterium]